MYRMTNIVPSYSNNNDPVLACIPIYMYTHIGILYYCVTTIIYFPAFSHKLNLLMRSAEHSTIL